MMRVMDPKPMIFLDLKGPQGNTLAILGACIRVARDAGWPRSTIEAFQRELLSGDREHVLDVLFECFDVQAFQRVAVGVDRSEVQ